MLGTFPFEQLISAQVTSRKSLKLVKYFKIPKLLRISRVMKYMRNHKHVYDFSKVLILIFTLLHVGACVWVLILDPCDETKNNYSDSRVCAQDNVYRVYSEALHISASMLLGVANFHIVGKPELLSLHVEGRPEDSTKMYLVSTLFMIVGLFLIALLMSEANVYVMGKMQGSAAFQRKTDRVNHEMEYYGVPDDLQVQVRAFYDYVWIHQKQYDDKIALLSDQQMSTDLQRKLALHLFKDVVSHISFFSEIDDLLLGEICMSLRTRIFLPHDMILFKGDVGKELFIIAKGVVEVLRDDLPANRRHNAPPILLRNGSFFGEIALVMEVRRTCSVQARTVCEVNILQQSAFDAVLRGNPHFARRMNELVVARQLDSCLARSHHQGVDFQVSQHDLNRAVAAMEKNMKEGLDRRQNTESSNGSTHSVHRPRVSFETTPKPKDSCDFSSPKSTQQPLHQPNDVESQIDASALSSNASEVPVADVLQDITIRSTRFADEEANVLYFEKIKQKVARPLSEQTVVEEDTDSIDVCSDGELESAKERERVYRRHKSTGISKAAKQSQVTVTQTDDELATRLTGHFTPGRCDLAKVRPLILNSRSDHRRGDAGNVSTLNQRLSLQSKMMEQLMSKIDLLESRARETMGKSAGSTHQNEKSR